MAQSTPGAKSEELVYPPNPSPEGGGGGIASVHRRSCLRRGAVAAAWSEVEADHGHDANAAVGGRGEAKAEAHVKAKVSNNLDDLRRELLRTATYVRSDGTAMPPVISGATQHQPCTGDLLILEHSDAAPNDRRQQQQATTAARYLGEALTKSLKSRPLGGSGIGGSRHGVAAARTVGGTVMGNRNANNAAANSNAKDTAGAAMSTPRKILGSIGSVALGLAQIVSPVLVRDTTGHYEDMDASFDEGSANGEEDGSGSRHLILDDDRDTICHVELAVDCSRLILGHAATTITEELDGPNDGTRLMHRFGSGRHSWAQFCRVAASTSDSAPLASEESNEDKVLRELLTGLSPADLELLLLGMVSAGYAVLSSDGDVVALLPGHSAATGTAANAVDEVHLAIFRLQVTVTTLERRIEHLSEQADAAQARALVVQKRRQSTLAINYLKLRNMRRKEIDRTSETLLNVEQSLQTLQRTRADAEVVRAYKLAGEAMKTVRKSEEEGGWGINADAVRDASDELAELTEEVNETSAALESMGVDNDAGAFSDEELMQELESLEEVDDLTDALGRVGLEENGNAEEAEQVTTPKVANLDAESGKEDDDECSRKNEAMVAS